MEHERMDHSEGQAAAVHDAAARTHRRRGQDATTDRHAAAELGAAYRHNEAAAAHRKAANRPNATNPDGSETDEERDAQRATATANDATLLAHEAADDTGVFVGGDGADATDAEADEREQAAHKAISAEEGARWEADARAETETREKREAEAEAADVEADQLEHIAPAENAVTIRALRAWARQLRGE